MDFKGPKIKHQIKNKYKYFEESYKFGYTVPDIAREYYLQLSGFDF